VVLLWKNALVDYLMKKNFCGIFSIKGAIFSIKGLANTSVVTLLGLRNLKNVGNEIVVFQTFRKVFLTQKR